MMTLLLVDWPFIWLVTGVGFLMVIILLIILMYIMKGLGAVVSRIADKPSKSSQNKEKNNEVTKSESAAQTGQEEIPVAAIAMALHLYYNSVHDEEPTSINIRRIENHGSQWNSKSFGMNNLHR